MANQYIFKWWLDISYFWIFLKKTPKPNRKHWARKNDHRSTKYLFTVLLIRKMKANCVSTYTDWRLYFWLWYNALMVTEGQEGKCSSPYGKTTQEGVWFPLRHVLHVIWGTEKERKKYKRVVNKRKMWKGIYPSALIRACSRFALMRFPACYSGWRASPATRFPWLCHDSVANTLQHSAQRSTLSHSLTRAAFYYNYFSINMILLQITGAEKQ